MSRLVAFAAIQGAYNIVSKAEGKFKQAMDKVARPADRVSEYGLLSSHHLLDPRRQDRKIGRRRACNEKMPGASAPHIKPEHNIHLPYLGGTLDSGMAAILAEEVVEAIRYVEDPDFYLRVKTAIRIMGRSGLAPPTIRS